MTITHRISHAIATTTGSCATITNIHSLTASYRLITGEICTYQQTVVYVAVLYSSVHVEQTEKRTETEQNKEKQQPAWQVLVLL